MSHEPPPSSPDPAGQSPQYEPPAPTGGSASAPSPGYGTPVDPYLPPSDPFHTPPPTAVWNPQPGGGDPYTPPGGYPPPSGDPYASPGGYPPPPSTPYGPTSGAGYAPSSGAPYVPSSGAGYQPPPDPYAPSSGAGYAPSSGAPYVPSSGVGFGPPPPVGPGYGPAGMPMMPVAPKKSNTLVIVLAVVGVLLVLCCGGGIFALVAADDDPIDRPAITYSPPAGPGLPTTVPTRGADTPPRTDGETDNMPIGDTLVLTSRDGDELRVTVQKVTSRKTGCRSYAPEPDNGTYLVVDVTVEVAKGNASINPLYFTFVDSSGTEESGLGGIFAGCGTALSSGVDLAAGTKRSGTVVFDVKAAKGRIVYAELLGGDARGSWKVG